MKMPSFAIVLPSKNRPRCIEGLITNIRETTPEAFSFYAAVTDPESKAILDHMGELVELTPPIWSSLQRAQYLYDQTSEDVVFIATDDFFFHPGWATAGLAMMVEVDGIVVSNDLFDGYPVGAGPFVSRRYAREEGCVFDVPGLLFHPDYHHGYADIEMYLTAINRDRFGWCAESVVEHLRHNSGRPGALSYDDTYRETESSYTHDAAVYTARQAMRMAVHG